MIEPRDLDNARIFSISIDEELNAFGEGIRIVELHDIGWAMRKVRLGEKVYRRGWNGPNQYLVLIGADYGEGAMPPWVGIRTAQKELIPWTCSQIDLLAEDWELRDLSAVR